MKLIKLLSLLLLALAVTNLSYTNKLIGYSDQISGLYQEISSIERQNKKLQLSVSKKGSLTNLRAAIEEAGFVQSTSIVTLGADQFVALSQ